MDYQPLDRAAYAFVRGTLTGFDYHLLGRADRGWVRAHIGKACGFSPARISRLIRQQAETGVVADRRARNSGRPFETVYTPADIRLLAEVDEAFGACRGWPRARSCAASSRCMATRASSGWRTCRARTSTTCARRAPTGRGGRLGRRRAPARWPSGSARRPSRTAGRASRAWTPSTWATGTGARGCASSTSWTRYEHVGEFTKSRPRHSNDNALVEGKNAHVVRKHLGHDHIPVRFAGDVDRFAREHLSPFLNFHRPCLFATERVDAKGKVRPRTPRGDCRALAKGLRPRRTREPTRLAKACGGAGKALRTAAQCASDGRRLKPTFAATGGRRTRAKRLELAE